MNKMFGLTDVVAGGSPPTAFVAAAFIASVKSKAVASRGGEIFMEASFQGGLPLWGMRCQ
jgi:hypothetical protein